MEMVLPVVIFAIGLCAGVVLRDGWAFIKNVRRVKFTQRYGESLAGKNIDHNQALEDMADNIAGANTTALLWMKIGAKWWETRVIAWILDLISGKFESLKEASEDIDGARKKMLDLDGRYMAMFYYRWVETRSPDKVERVQEATRTMIKVVFNGKKQV